MATGKKETETSTLGRLSKRGEEALARLADELGKNERVTHALDRAVSAKGRLDGASRRALGQVGLAAADELGDLRRQVERLEKRLAKLEATSGAKSSGGKKTAASRATTSARRKKTADKGASPAPGRAVGGGTGRGSSAGGGAPAR